MKEKIFFRTEYKYPGYKIFMFEIYFFQERTFLNFRKSSPVANPDKGSHYLKKSPSPTGVKSPPGHCCHENLSHWWPIYGFIVEGLCFCGSLMHLDPIWYNKCIVLIPVSHSPFDTMKINHLVILVNFTIN